MKLISNKKYARLLKDIEDLELKNKTIEKSFLDFKEQVNENNESYRNRSHFHTAILIFSIIVIGILLTLWMSERKENKLLKKIVS